MFPVWLFECVTREPTRAIAEVITLLKVRHFLSVPTVEPFVRLTQCV